MIQQHGQVNYVFVNDLSVHLCVIMVMGLMIVLLL